jgi:hypothetical protein
MLARRDWITLFSMYACGGRMAEPDGGHAGTFLGLHILDKAVSVLFALEIDVDAGSQFARRVGQMPTPEARKIADIFVGAGR